jgi:integrase
MKLTTAAVTTLACDGPDRIEWDDSLPGFGVRCRNGRKSFVCQFRIGTQQRRETLGDVRKIKLEDARKVARQRFAQVELGVDPVATKANERAAVRLTLGHVADRYLEARKDAVRPATLAAATHFFAVQWKSFRERPIASIRRADIAARLQEIITAHGRVSAARARAYLSALFTWARREGLCDSNPVTDTNNPGAGLPSRDRVLNAAEIKLIWDACGDDDPGRIARLLLLTACRRDEISRLSWKEVDLDRGTIVIESGRAKNRKTHALPLPAVALNLLRSVPRRRDTEFVFGGDQGYTGWANATNKLRARMAKPVEFRLHDLRRTAATGMADLGVQPHIIEAVLNHSNGSRVAATYNRSTYTAEKAAALALWADHVLAIVKGRKAKVVAMPARHG